MDCVNLKERFGNRFKIQHEESYAAERSEFRTAQEPWLQIIPCRHGHICPWGRSTLAACTDKAGGVARRLKALPFTTVAQDGDDGANILFDMEHFEAVAEIIKPKRLPGPRKLTEEQRAGNFTEVELGFEEQAAVEEGKRCLQCAVRLQIPPAPRPPVRVESKV